MPPLHLADLLSLQVHGPRLAAIYHYDKKLFEQRFLGKPGVPSSNGFIRSLTTQGHQPLLGTRAEQCLLQVPPCAERPCSLPGTVWRTVARHEATDLSKCIPLIVHADDAESHRRRSFTVCSMSSLLVEGGSPWESRLLLYCIDVARSCAETTDALDAYLVWSFTELSAGRYLEHGPWSEDMPRRAQLGGKPIADGWRAIVCVHRGDEKYLQKCYHMRISLGVRGGVLVLPGFKATGISEVVHILRPECVTQDKCA